MKTNDIPIDLLKSLLIFSSSKNIVEAATVLRITQPGLSKQLKQLEGLLPHKLFIMEGKKKVLTPFGEELVTQISVKLAGLDDVVQQTCTKFSNPEESTIRISGRINVLERITTKLTFPGRLVFIDQANSETIKAVLNQSAELGITYLTNNSLDLIARPLFKERFKLVVPKNMMPERPLNLKAALTELKGMKCLTYKEPDELFDHILSNFNISSKDLHVKRTVSNFYTLKDISDSGLGWTIIPRHFEINTVRNWELDISSKYHPSRQFNLFYRKEMVNSPWLKLLKNEIEQILK